MQKKTILFEQSYSAPTLDLYTITVESGFQTSLEGACIEDATVENWANL